MLIGLPAHRISILSKSQELYNLIKRSLQQGISSTAVLQKIHTTFCVLNLKRQSQNVIQGKLEYFILIILIEIK